MKITKFLTKQTIVVTFCAAASLLALPGCKKKGTESEQSAAQAAEAVAASEPTVDLDPASFNSQRAQAFGFLSRMPATTEGAIGIRNLSDVIGGFLNSNTYKRAVALAQEFGETGFDPQQAEMVQVMADQYVGKELFLIFSAGSGKQFERLQLVSSLMSDLNLRSAGQTVAGGASDGSQLMEGMLSELRSGLKDGSSELSKALEAFEFPPIIIGSQVADGAAEVIAQLSQLEAQLPPIFTVSKSSVGGGEFTSWKLVLQDVITEDFEHQINEFLQDAASAKRVAEILRKKTIEFSFGVVDNYLLFTLGSDHKHLEFVTKPEESILAARAFGFSDQFISKKLIGYSFMSNAMLSGAAKGGQVKRMADSFASGVAGGEPEMEKLGGLVQKLAGHIEKLSARSSQTHVGVAYMENGIHGESIGGYTSEMIDWKANSRFANSAPADAAMVFSTVANPVHRGESVAMLETAFSLVDLGSDIWSKNSGDQQVAQMKGMFGGDLAKIWGIMKGEFLDGLGFQRGIIVDLKGGMPKGIPNVEIPRVIQNEGKVPRIALATDVQNRAKLVVAWENFVPVLNEALVKFPGQEAGAEVQVPDTITDESDDLDTHYFPLPFLSNDFMPSLSLNDELFYLSSSKQFAQALAAEAKAGKGEIRGIYMMVSFSEIQRFAENWLQLILQNADTVFPSPAQATEFQQTAGQVQALMEFTRGIRSFKANRYQTDEGAMRSSWHFHFEDIGEEVD